MKLTSFSSEYFEWEELSSDDFICRIGKFTLRVEQMDFNHWWWQISFMGCEIPEITNSFCESKHRAIGRCEGMYLALSKSKLNEM